MVEYIGIFSSVENVVRPGGVTLLGDFQCQLAEDVQPIRETDAQEVVRYVRRFLILVDALRDGLCF